MLNFITNTLRGKLTALLLVVSIVPLVGLGYLSYVQGRKIIEKQATNALAALAESREQNVIMHLERRMEQVEILAANEPVQLLVEEWNKKENGQPLDEAALKQMTEHFSKIEFVEYQDITSFYEYIFIGKTGKVYLASDPSLIGKDMAGDKRFIRGLKEKFYTDMRIDEKRKVPSYGVVVPIYPHEAVHKEVIGVLIATMGTQWLNNIMADLRGLGSMGETYLVNKDGYFITDVRFVKDAVLRQKVSAEILSALQIQKKDGVVGIFPDYERGYAVCAAAGDELEEKFSLGWTILAQMDTSEVFAPVRVLFGFVSLVTLSMVFVVVGIGIFFSGLLAVPILKLKDAAAEIGKGKLDTRVTIKSKDEIGFLAASFNKMAENLSGAMEKEKKLAAAAAESEKKKAEGLATMNEELAATNEELSQTNEELESTTEELRAANEEAQKAKEIAEKKAEVLEKFNKVAVGRELEMTAMKKRIKELEAQKGESPQEEGGK